MSIGLIKRRREIASATRARSDEIEWPVLPSLPLIEDDELLDLLRKASNEMLAPLVEFVCEKGRPTSRLEQTEDYRRYAPNHKRYVNEIVAEIQRYGANDIATRLRRGKGVRYAEITEDVAKRLGVTRGSKDTEELEEEIVKKIFCDACENMTPDQQLTILRSLRVRNLSGAGTPIGTFALQSAVNGAGFPAYQATVIVANAMARSILGHGLSFTTNWVLTKGLSILAGPFGLSSVAVLVLNMFAAPAYRVTIPCVAQVALIRRQIRLRTIARYVLGFLIAVALLGLLVCLAFLKR